LPKKNTKFSFWEEMATLNFNDPNDATMQEVSSWLATRLRRSNCGINIDMSCGVELTSSNSQVDLFIPYVSGNTRMELRFPVSSSDIATTQSMHNFVQTVVADDLDRNTRYLLPFMRDVRLAFPTHSIWFEIDLDWINPSSQTKEAGLVVILANVARTTTFVVSKNVAFYECSPMLEIERLVPTKSKFVKRLRTIVRMRYKNGIARAASTQPLEKKYKHTNRVCGAKKGVSKQAYGARKGRSRR
jgi:hypothetical protein